MTEATSKDPLKNSRISGWVDSALQAKEAYVTASDDPYCMPNTVVGYREGKPQLLVMHQGGKPESFRAMLLMREGLCCDEMMMMADSCTINQQGKTREEIDALVERYSGENRVMSMQEACEKEQARERGLITDTMSVWCLDKHERFHMASVPYTYPPLVFHREDMMSVLDAEVRDMDLATVHKEAAEREARGEEPDPDEPPQIGGHIPCTMVEIMRRKDLFSTELSKIASVCGFDPADPEDRKQMLFHQGVAMRAIFENDERYMVMEPFVIEGSIEESKKAFRELVEEREAMAKNVTRLRTDLQDPLFRTAHVPAIKEALGLDPDVDLDEALNSLTEASSDDTTGTP